MARGIDGEAHRGALDAGGRTVAVLGCGIDRDYPAAHAELARRIGENGLVVSEYEPGVEPAPWRFPARNRIIAGLCARHRRRRGARAKRRAHHGRLRARGGPRRARRTGRDHELAVGRHERAAPARRGAGDVRGGRARAVRPRAAPCRCRRRSGLLAEALLARLRGSALTADELVRATALDPGASAAALMELELAGRVTFEDGVYRAAI